MFLVRSSKFRHVFGSPARKELCYEGIKITKNAHDSNFCAVNPKFLAVVTESAGGGVFLVLPLKQTGRVSSSAPKVCGHRGPVTDVKWNPFNDNVIASCSDDTTIKIWQIPDGGLVINVTEWMVDLHGHSKRVSYIEWHPTAENILLSAGTDFKCMLWNVESAECIQTIAVHPDTIFSISWNRDGSLFATTCKDKCIRVIDPRAGTVVAQGQGHLGAKASKAIFLDNHRLFTTGFSKMSERQLAVWDVDNLSKPLKMDNIDASSGVLIPYYDYDTKVMFLAGKGDGNIRYYEIVEEAPFIHFLSQFQSGSPQRGFGQMPKRGLDFKKCEIVRFYKLHTQRDICEPLSMIVPRKSEIFQDDLYPPTASSCQSMSADEWISGMNRDPIVVSLKDGPMTNAPQVTTYRAVKGVAEVNALNRQTGNATSTGPTPPVQLNNRVPASIRNIYRLSGAEEQFMQYQDNSNKMSVFETRRTIAHTQQTSRLTNANEPIKVDKKVLTQGYTCVLNNNLASSESTTRQENEKTKWVNSQLSKKQKLASGNVPTTEAELRKAYLDQVEELQSLKEQLTLKENRIRQLEEEVKMLRHGNISANVKTLS